MFLLIAGKKGQEVSPTVESRGPDLAVPIGTCPVAASVPTSLNDSNMSLALSEDSPVASGRLAVGVEVVLAVVIPPYIAPALPPVPRIPSMQALFWTPGPVGGGIPTHSLA